VDIKHTPTPWYVSIEDGMPILGANGARICDTDVCDADSELQALAQETQQAVDAAFIVRACNAHEDLTEALASIIADYEATIDVAKQGKIAEISLGQFRRLSLAKARLAKAEGK
jgi:hypothetical protein